MGQVPGRAGTRLRVRFRLMAKNVKFRGLFVFSFLVSLVRVLKIQKVRKCLKV